MHAYYPSLTSWPSLLGDMLADAINCVGFTWVRKTKRQRRNNEAVILTEESGVKYFSATLSDTRFSLLLQGSVCNICKVLKESTASTALTLPSPLPSSPVSNGGLQYVRLLPVQRYFKPNFTRRNPRANAVCILITANSCRT